MKIAVIGLGNHAQKNTIPAIIACENLELAGVYSRDTLKASKVASLYNVKASSSLNELMQDDEVKAVYIATPNGVHFEQIKESLEHNKHVFCEKPLTTSLAQTKEACDLARSKGVVLAECFMYQYHSQYKKLRLLINEGEIGEVRSIHARFGYPHLPNDNLRYDPALGGGALMDASVYPISLINSLLGSSNRVVGHLSRFGDYKVDTDGDALLIGENGMTGHAQWGMGRDYCNDVLVWGTKGQLKAERVFSKPPHLETYITVIKNGQEELLTIEPDNHFVSMFDFFAAATQSEHYMELLLSQILTAAKSINELKLQS